VGLNVGFDVGRAVRVAGGGLAAAGALAVGAAAGAALERLVMLRTARRDSSLPAPDFPTQVREVITADGTCLHVEVDDPGGAASRLTVIFCHGYALSLDSWRYQRRDLQGKARLVFYDQRSHGKSDRAEFDTHHVDQLGSDLFDIITALAPEGPLVLVGHSMGGMTIMALAEQHPELFKRRVFGVALIATSAGGLAEVSLGLPSFVGPVLQRLASPAAAALARQKAVVELSRRTTTDLGLLLTRLYAFGSVASDEAGRFVAQMIAATPIDVLAEFLPALQDHDKRDALAILQQCEVLVVVGDADRLTPPQHSAQIVHHIPGAEFVIVAKGGHMVFVEHHEQVDALLEELIDRVWRNITGFREEPVA